MLKHGEVNDGAADQSADQYETPRLVPVGNLRDLLAGGGSQPCDGAVPQPGGSPDTCG